MTIAFVQQKNASVNSGTTGISPTLDSAPGSGSLLVCGHSSNASDLSGGIVGYGSTAWGIARESAFNNYEASLWYALVDTTPATTGTVTPAGSAKHCVAILEFSGIDSSGTLQAQNDRDSGTGTTATTGPITAAAGPCLYVSILTLGGSRTASAGPGDGFTALTTVVTPDSETRSYLAYRIDTTPASATPSYTVGSGQWEITIVAFKGSAVTSGAAVRSLRSLDSLSSLRAR